MWDEAGGKNIMKELKWTFDQGILVITKKRQKDLSLSASYGIDANAEGEYPWSNIAHKIKTVVISDGVTSIGERAFMGYQNLTSVIIGNGVKVIYDHAFDDCGNLKSILIGKNVTRICKNAFSNCRSITSITIPSSVKKIEKEAFRFCTALTSVNITDIEAWCKIEFAYCTSNPLFYAKKLYLNGKLLTNLIIPDGITSIRKYAFYNCIGIVNATISGSVANIGECAFEYCSNLKRLTWESGIPIIQPWAFHGCEKLETIYLGEYIWQRQDNYDLPF